MRVPAASRSRARVITARTSATRGRHGRQLLEGRRRRAGHDARQRGLPAAGRPVEDHRRHPVARDRLAQGAARARAGPAWPTTSSSVSGRIRAASGAGCEGAPRPPSPKRSSPGGGRARGASRHPPGARARRQETAASAAATSGSAAMPQIAASRPAASAIAPKSASPGRRRADRPEADHQAGRQRQAVRAGRPGPSRRSPRRRPSGRSRPPRRRRARPARRRAGRAAMRGVTSGISTSASGARRSARRAPRRRACRPRPAPEKATTAKPACLLREAALVDQQQRHQGEEAELRPRAHARHHHEERDRTCRCPGAGGVVGRRAAPPAPPAAGGRGRSQSDDERAGHQEHQRGPLVEERDARARRAAARWRSPALPPTMNHASPVAGRPSEIRFATRAASGWKAAMPSPDATTQREHPRVAPRQPGDGHEPGADGHPAPEEDGRRAGGPRGCRRSGWIADETSREAPTIMLAARSDRA